MLNYIVSRWFVGPVVHIGTIDMERDSQISNSFGRVIVDVETTPQNMKNNKI